MSNSIGPKIPIIVRVSQGDPWTAIGNAMLRSFQPLIQPNVISLAFSIPPVSPTNGDTYVVGSSPTGLWSGQANSIAYWSTDNPQSAGEWEFYPPLPGWVVSNRQDGAQYIFDGTVWKPVSFNVSTQRRIGLISRQGVSGPVPQTFGDDFIAVNSASVANVDPTDDHGPVITYSASVEATDSAYGFSGDLYWRTGRNVATWVSVYFPGPTDIRTWIALTDEASDGDNTFGSSDAPSGNFAAFRYSTMAGDTHWQCICSDGSATTQIATSVPFDTKEHAWGIQMDDNNGRVLFYIDGILVGVVTTHLPTPHTNVRVYVTSCKHALAPTGSDLIGLDQIHTSADTRAL
jgi:hypothetical protein